MSRTTIHAGVSVSDGRVQFDGVSVRRRSVSWADGRTAVVVEPPSRDMAVGDRVVGADNDCGYGRLVSVDGRGGVALFTSALGGEFTARVADRARVLPDRMEASVRGADGQWRMLDVTDDVLALTYRDFRRLIDGAPQVDLLPCAAGVEEIELAAAVSFYFGRLPDPVEAGLAPSFTITQIDLHQARAEIIRMAREPDMQASQENLEMENESAMAL